MRKPPPLVLAAASGVLLTLSFPKFGHWSMAWLALLPLLLAIESTGGREGFRLGYASGLLAGVGILYWTALVVVQYGGLPLPLGVLSMLLLAAAVALFAGVFGWLVALWRRRLGRPALLLAPLAWVTTEFLRAHTLCRFAWCLLGYSQQPNPAVIQMAALTAVYGVSFVLALTSATAAFVLAEPRRKPRLAAAVGGFGVVAGVLGYGTGRLARPEPAAETLRVGLVQPRILQEEKWDPARSWENVEQHVTLTRAAAAQGARLVAWPESSVPFLYDRDRVLADALQSLVAETRVDLLFGNDDVEARPGGRPRIFVGAKLLAPDGSLALRYHKMRLVPFGEYTPLEPLLSLGGRFAARLVQQVGEFTPGDHASVGEAAGHRLGAFICYEAIFPDLVRQFTANGAELLVNITNDAWYGTTSAPYQHFAMAAFRAVENGRPLLRAANTGVTALVDARGRVVEQTRLFDRTVLVRDVRLTREDTFYARHGDVFAWGCAALTALACLARRPA